LDNWLSFVANILEIVGFLITLWVAFAVKKIRDFYTATAM
jgi:multisubunit Na+/H+ antiporter MnhG subunit